MLAAEVYKQVRQIHIRTKRLVDGIFAGEYHSVFKGRGMEFAEVREYVPGDDVRTIDWNVTARVGQPFVKKYIEERDLTVMLLVDVSGSGRFGSVRKLKSDLATELSAVVALSAVANNDRVGLIMFSDRIETYIAPQKGKNRALRVIRELLTAAPKGRGTNIAHALEFLVNCVPQRSVAFLISDFLGSDYDKALRLAHQRHDVIPIRVSDPREAALPALGLITLEDPESGSVVTIDSASASVRADYGARLATRDTRRRQLFRTLAMDPIEVRTDQPLLNPLLRFFRQRQRRLSQGR